MKLLSSVDSADSTSQEESTHSFELKEAENGREAFDIWEAWEPNLIWMDMRMPVMDGYKATERIKSTVKGQATAVIALTASAFEEEKIIVLSAGCDDFLRKPFREIEIFDMLHKHLGLQFIYEEERKKEDRRPKVEYRDALAPEALTTLPAEWLETLRQGGASSRSDYDRQRD